MNQYLMINHGVGTPAKWAEYFEMLQAGGHVIGGSSLDENAALSLKGNVFADAISKTITGYIVIKAADLKTAKRIMAQSPIHQAGGTVELFPLVES
ncbi:MAG: hypothetical protein ABIP97_05460 [Chthoniobacterales bacterium]